MICRGSAIWARLVSGSTQDERISDDRDSASAVLRGNDFSEKA
jgi:hypothetical protein